jgi:RNA polymerase sigma-70 factor (ECF subfamily)
MSGNEINKEPAMEAAVGVLAGTRVNPALAEMAGEARGSVAWQLEAARQGDADAFTAIVRRFEDTTYQFVMRMVRRPAVAEDVSQDVFIRLWRHLAEIQSADMLPGWLRRVAANAVIDHWRKEEARERRTQMLREHPVARYVMKPSSRMETRETLDVVQGALAALPVKLRSVLVLRTMEDLSYEELSDVLGLSVHAVRSRLFRARQELLTILRQKDAPEYLARMYQPADTKHVQNDVQ